MAGFFAEPKARKKRRQGGAEARGSTKRKRLNDKTPIEQPRQREQRDESISGSDSDDSIAQDVQDEAASEPDDETAAEKRLRLAEQYLDKVRGEVVEEGDGGGEGPDALVERRLREDVAESQGRMYRDIATSFDYGAAQAYPFRAPPKCTTAIAACEPYVYTAYKDGTLIKWEIPPAES